MPRVGKQFICLIAIHSEVRQKHESMVLFHGHANMGVHHSVNEGAILGMRLKADLAQKSFYPVRRYIKQIEVRIVFAAAVAFALECRTQEVHYVDGVVGWNNP